MINSVNMAWLTIAVAVIVFAIKLLAWWLTGSVALFSDALESIVNIVGGSVALVALRIATKPPDAEHPYGHHKAEYFSAILSGVFIILAALAILHAAIRGLMDPQPLQAPLGGLALAIVATILNGGWALMLRKRGRALRSPALLAESGHLMTDVWTSIGVVAGFALVAVTGWLILDPLVAIAVALNILWSGWKLLHQSADGLMDRAVSDAERAQISAIVTANGEGALEAHDLKTRHAGSATFIEFHLVVPRAMTVEESHDICDRIERAIRREIEGAMITIHVEPDPKVEEAPCIPIADGGG
ncbi:MAG: putative Co/Zn/Cd cation transporter [Saliniramus fredricksonii]|uniref:Protein p34 n=1 Tax=Saliniramus fredricksonii TaxID=1653334 RepID=A0A0N8KDU8_9HYPH|nr:cation diffusion facilitator family transporter [Saliniramus fredricksonii]KPQ09538.1 MAG: putative Co/Zn/Cd cation transporter [Saliniramus fredricksonii]SCC78291.1 cation diffusion facilitator family transporter [Saliniramus fredricksonii]